jgi:hypothetical protein
VLVVVGWKIRGRGGRLKRLLVRGDETNRSFGSNEKLPYIGNLVRELLLFVRWRSCRGRR